MERHAGTDSAGIAEYRAGVPLRRLGLPLDVAGAVSWLASEAASFVTGARLRVTGGSTIS